MITFRLQKYKSRPMKMYAKTKKNCNEVKGQMLGPEWIMSFADIIEPTK